MRDKLLVVKPAVVLATKPSAAAASASRVGSTAAAVPAAAASAAVYAASAFPVAAGGGDLADVVEVVDALDDASEDESLLLGDGREADEGDVTVRMSRCCC